jgi:predicted N-acetyltransferase YhbS
LTPSEARLPSLSSDVAIRPLLNDEVDLADRVMGVAFGTFFGAPEPTAAMGDMECVRPRFVAAPGWALAAELDGEVVGSNLATRWGSFAFFGPLTVRRALWDRGIASALMRPIVDAGALTVAEGARVRADGSPPGALRCSRDSRGVGL